MATQTTNYGFKKPLYTDAADISVINENMDAIDTKMKEIEDKSGSGGGTGLSVKTLEYVGNGSTTNVIEFPEVPSIILGGFGQGMNNTMVNFMPYVWGSTHLNATYNHINSTSGGLICNIATVKGNTLTIKGGDAGSVLNVSGDNVVIIYI